MEPIRVLQVVTIMNRGGLETMLMNYYRKMDRKKIQFDFMVNRTERGNYDDEIEQLGGKIYRMPPIRPGSYSNYFTLLDQFFEKHKEYKIVHSHINENSSFVLRAAKNANVPCRIAHSHLSDLGIDLKFPFRLYARNSMKDYPTSYFACSKKAGTWLFGKNRVKMKQVRVLNNAVNVEEYLLNQQVREKVRKEWNAENKLVIGHIGRFNKQKNHEFLLKIFQKIKEKNRDSLLVLVGEGHLKAAMERKVYTLGLKDHVTFLGLRDDIPSIMQGFDLFLFPSLFEGLPVVLIEAQAAGLNCIVSHTITTEADIANRMKFLDLNLSPEDWAQEVLDTSIEHENNSTILRHKGYDTATMADWLYEYYLTFNTKTENKVIGGVTH